MPSQALANLGSRLEDVDQLMHAHAAVGGLERGRRFNVEGLNRAAVLMLSAHLEGYLEDTMTEALAAVNPLLDSAPLVRTFANPRPDFIDRLFGFLGMEQPVRAVKWNGASNKMVRANLEWLVNTRNKLAHGTTDVKVYKYEVERYRGYVERFTEAFDSLVGQRVKELTGTYPWHS